METIGANTSSAERDIVSTDCLEYDPMQDVFLNKTACVKGEFA